MKENYLVTIPVFKNHEEIHLEHLKNLNVSHFILPQISSVRIDTTSLAYYLNKAIKKEIILTINTVDTNLRYIQSRILGAQLFNLSKFIITRGDSKSIQKSNDKVINDSKPVFEYPTTEVINHISNMTKGYDFLQNKLNGEIDAYIGSTIELPDISNKNIDLVKNKIINGTKFFITNPIYEYNKYKEFLNSYEQRFNSKFVTDIYVSIRMDLPRNSFYDKEFKKSKYLSTGLSKDKYYFNLVNHFKANGINKFNFILPSNKYNFDKLNQEIILINNIIEKIKVKN